MTTQRPRGAHRGGTPREDVARARAAVRRADVPFGPPPSPRTAADRWRDFVARYGWRAYALPLLIVVTVFALMSTGATPAQQAKRASGAAPHRVTAPPPVTHSAGSNHTDGAPPATSPTAAPSAAPSIALKSDAAGPNADTLPVKSAALPAGAPYTVRGDGTFRTLPGTSPKVGHGPLYRYSIDVENGIKGINLTQFQNMVVSVLSDKRSWAGHGDVTLQRVDSGKIDFHVTLTSAMTVRRLCGYSIPVETSCYQPASSTTPVNRVVMNDARWMRGAAAYIGDLHTYRVYMINHEDGHAIGHEHAHECLSNGLAPVMMQQTYGLRSAATGGFCQANPWPYPAGATDAPGAEQPDTPANDEYGLNGSGD